MIVADASVLVKLVLNEAGSEAASEKLRGLIKEGETVSSPATAFAESMNAVWKHYVLLKDITKNDFEKAVGAFPSVWDKVVKVSAESLFKRAIVIAAERRISVYDSLYLANCQMNGGSLFTFDIKLKEKADALRIPTVED